MRLWCSPIRARSRKKSIRTPSDGSRSLKPPLRHAGRSEARYNCRRALAHRFLRAATRHCADESALNQAASGAPVAFAGALKMALKADTDPVAERARLDKEIRRIEAELSKCRVKLSNEAFVSKAPEVIVGQERKRASEYEAVRDALIAQRARI